MTVYHISINKKGDSMLSLDPVVLRLEIKTLRDKRNNVSRHNLKKISKYTTEIMRRYTQIEYIYYPLDR